jgi:hypothetical protein
VDDQQPPALPAGSDAFASRADRVLLSPAATTIYLPLDPVTVANPID